MLSCISLTKILEDGKEACVIIPLMLGASQAPSQSEYTGKGFRRESDLNMKIKNG